MYSLLREYIVLSAVAEVTEKWLSSIDGTQCLTTPRSYINNEFALSRKLKPVGLMARSMKLQQGNRIQRNLLRKLERKYTFIIYCYKCNIKMLRYIGTNEFRIEELFIMTFRNFSTHIS